LTTKSAGHQRKNAASKLKIAAPGICALSTYSSMVGAVE